MTFGITTWKADGTPIVTPDGAGGVYVETYSREIGAGSGTKTYSDLTGMTLRVWQVGAGSFTWAVGVDGAGNPYITFTALPATQNGGPLLILVFAA